MLIFSKTKGFSLIELLVVISIIGLLSTLGLVALSNGRAKARDAKRVADLKQIQKALEMYYNEPSTGGYPSTSNLALGKSSGLNDCNSDECVKINIDGIVNQSNSSKPVFMELIPPDPSAGTEECDGTNVSPCHYRYNGGGNNFKIDFYLEKGIENLQRGNRCLTAVGFINNPCSGS